MPIGIKAIYGRFSDLSAGFYASVWNFAQSDYLLSSFTAPIRTGYSASQVIVQVVTQDVSGTRAVEARCLIAARASPRQLFDHAPCCRNVVTAVRIRPANREPDAPCVPEDFRRHNTARLSGRSALLLVGPTSDTTGAVAPLLSYRVMFDTCGSVTVQSVP